VKFEDEAMGFHAYPRHALRQPPRIKRTAHQEHRGKAMTISARNINQWTGLSLLGCTRVPSGA